MFGCNFHFLRFVLIRGNDLIYKYLKWFAVGLVSKHQAENSIGIFRSDENKQLLIAIVVANFSLVDLN